MEKWLVAQKMIENGDSNAVILGFIAKKYGTGISKTKLAEFRAAAKSPSRKGESLETRATKREFIRKCLGEGMSIYAVQKASKLKFSRGSGYSTIRSVQQEMDEASGDGPVASYLKGAKKEAKIPAKKGAKKGVKKGVKARTIVPVDIPEEVFVRPPFSDSPSLSQRLGMLKAVRAWMLEINAKSLTIHEGGEVSVEITHRFGLGDGK